MSKRIESIEDLAGIAGAELGTKKSKSKIEKAVETDSPTPVVKHTKTIKSAKKTAKVHNSITDPDTGPRNGDVIKGVVVDHLTRRYNAFEVGYIEHYPYAQTSIDELRNAPNPINGYTRTLKKGKLPGLIKKGLKRAENFRAIYEQGVDRGDNSIGYVLASISAERDAARMQAYLIELEEKA